MSSETTFSDSYSLKLIGTSREAGTWGASTNETIKRIEDILGKTVSLDVTAMPVGSTSAASDGSTPATWVTVNASNSGQAGSEGRSRVVEFSGTVTGNITVNIRGGSGSTIPSRVFFAKNSLTAPYTLTLDAGGVDLDIPNGETALVVVVPSTTGGYAAGVHNLLSNFRSDNIKISSGGEVNFVGAGTIDFDGNGTVEIPASTGTFTVSDGTNSLLVVDVPNNRIRVGRSSIDTTLQNTTLTIRDSQSNSFTISDGVTNFLVFDTDSNVIGVGAPLDINAGSIDVASQATSIVISPSAASALVITDGPVTFLTVVSTNGSEAFNIGVKASVPDLRVTGSDGYINFDATEGTSGFGIRNSSGVIQAKHSGGSWFKVHSSFIQTAITNATASEVAGQNKQGALDIGPFRIIFNTFDASPGSNLVTLGDAGVGTSANMASALYTVFAVCAEDSEPQGVAAYVTSSSSRTLTVWLRTGAGNRLVTYFAIGDSGA